uniref:Protein kinase domain-containing protein n=1 Tax=Globodera rostochiensis TaxID=31243 RepID=A0A914HI34_GLORO
MDRTLKKLLIQKDDELGKGGFGKVFVAFVKNGEALGIPENRCLAVKEIELDGRGNISSKGFRNSAKVLNKIEKLDDAKKRHLLKIYDL